MLEALDSSRQKKLKRGSAEKAKFAQFVSIFVLHWLVSFLALLLHLASLSRRLALACLKILIAHIRL